MTSAELEKLEADKQAINDRVAKATALREEIAELSKMVNDLEGRLRRTGGAPALADSARLMDVLFGLFVDNPGNTYIAGWQRLHHYRSDLVPVLQVALIERLKLVLENRRQQFRDL